MDNCFRHPIRLDGEPWPKEDLVATNCAWDAIRIAFSEIWKALHAGDWDKFQEQIQINVDNDLAWLNDEEVIETWSKIKQTSQDQFDEYKKRRFPDHKFELRRSSLLDLLPALGDLLTNHRQDRDPTKFQILTDAKIHCDHWNWAWPPRYREEAPLEEILKEAHVRHSILKSFQCAWGEKDSDRLRSLLNEENTESLWRIATGDQDLGKEIQWTIKYLQILDPDGFEWIWTDHDRQLQLGKLMRAGIRSLRCQPMESPEISDMWEQVLMSGPLDGDYTNIHSSYKAVKGASSTAE